MELQRRDRIGRSVCHAKLLHDRGPGGLWRDRQHQRPSFRLKDKRKAGVLAAPGKIARH